MKLTLALSAACCAAATLAADFPAYSPVGYDTGVRDRPTGFFRVLQKDDGRWWVIDPVGRGIVLLGVDHVTYQGHWCEKTQRHHHLEWMKKRFPDVEDWRKDTIGRLTKWGFNLLGAGSSDDLRHRGLVHTVFLSMGDSWASEKDENLWICPNERRPCSAFPNVFHPDWAKHCDEVAAKLCAPNREDPWLFGYFIDNELAWWGRSREWGVSAEGLFDEAMKRPEGHSARAAAQKFAADAGVKPGDPVPADVKLAFLRRAAELYFSCASAAIRRADPNHVVMGARFAGISGAHPAVWEASGRYCDLVTFNCYPWADLDRNVVLNDAWSRKEPVADAFRRVHSWVKKPMLVTEWSFPALDSGLPCTQGAGQRFRTQADRTAATELFAKTMLSMPFLIGYDYFMWVDEPARGITSAFPENTNYGLINERGEAYPEITAMFERLHRDLGKWRQAGVPAVREAPAAREDVRAELERLNAGVPTLRTECGARSYVLADSTGVRLEGAVGGRDLFGRVAIGDVEFGRLTFMVNFIADGRDIWCDLTRVDGARETADGALRIRATGAAAGRAFAAELEVRLLPGRGKYVVDLVSLANSGTVPLEVRRVFFRQYAPFAGETPAVERVPTLWKAPSQAEWVAKDGRYCAAFTRSSLADYFAYYVDETAHPDASFRPGVASGQTRTLAAGEGWTPAGEAYVVGCIGTGGPSALRLAVE